METINKPLFLSLGAYLQKLQLSLLVVPRDELSDFVAYWNDFLKPSVFLSQFPLSEVAMARENLTVSQIDDLVKCDDERLSRGVIDDFRQEFQGLGLCEKLSAGISICLNSKEVRIKSHDLILIVYVLTLLDKLLESEEIAYLNELQNARFVILHIKKNVFKPRLSKSSYKLIDLPYEHFGMNPIHPKIGIKDSMGELWILNENPRK